MLKNDEEDDIQHSSSQGSNINRKRRSRRRLSTYEQSRIINPGQKRKVKTLRYRKAKQKEQARRDYKNIMITMMKAKKHIIIKDDGQQQDENNEENNESRKIEIRMNEKGVYITVA